MTPNFIVYLQNVVNTHDEAHPHLRWGQTYSSLLNKYVPNLALTVLNTDIDPYYDDRKIPEFVQHIRERWGFYD